MNKKSRLFRGDGKSARAYTFDRKAAKVFEDMVEENGSFYDEIWRMTVE